MTVLHLFLNKQSIFEPCPENCLSFSKKSPQKILTPINYSYLNIQTYWT